MGEAGGAASKDELWSRLQEIQRKEMETVQQERIALEEEKKQMNKIKTDSSDILSINVGGEIVIQAQRETLCIATKSTFSNMFNGRWEDSCIRDEHGHIFLDHDPEIIQWIVNFLRVKKIEDPSKPFRPPLIANGKKDAAMCALNYFGLKEFFYPFLNFFPSNLAAIQSSTSVTTQQDTGSESLRCTYTGSGYYSVAFTPALDGGTGPFFWKCTISSLPSNGWVYLGVIGHLNASNDSYGDSTSYGWATSKQQYTAGVPSWGAGGWSGFEQGEVLYFQKKDDVLTMFSKQKNQSFVINTVPDKVYVHFNFYQSGTEIVLEPIQIGEIDETPW